MFAGTRWVRRPYTQGLDWINIARPLHIADLRAARDHRLLDLLL